MTPNDEAVLVFRVWWYDVARAHLELPAFPSQKNRGKCFWNTGQSFS